MMANRVHIVLFMPDLRIVGAAHSAAFPVFQKALTRRREYSLSSKTTRLSSLARVHIAAEIVKKSTGTTMFRALLRFAAHTFAAAVAAIALAAVPHAAHAQDYPNKPIKLVVPFPPGGPLDLAGRAIGQRLSEAWGQPVVIENKPGAGGNIGADMVAKSPRT